MHTHIYEDVVFNHNGGYDGNIHITAPDQPTIIIPFLSVLGLVGGYMRSEEINRLESLDDAAVVRGIR